jgi:IclR helix-turn-helix domain
MVGVDEPEAWRVVRKAGLDSMPAARRQALELLVASKQALSTTEIAAELGLPTPSTRRVLEDLAAHGVIGRESQGQGKADLWQIDARALNRECGAECRFQRITRGCHRKSRSAQGVVPGTGS